MRYLTAFIAVALFTCVFTGCSYRDYIPGDQVELKNGTTLTVRWQNYTLIQGSYVDDGQTYITTIHKKFVVPRDTQTEEQKPTRWTIDD